MVSRQDSQTARCSSSLLCSSWVNWPEVETAHSSRNSLWGSVNDNVPAPRSYKTFSYCSVTRQFVTKKLFSQPFQSAKVVMFDIPSGLAQLRRDFVKGIAFHKV